jgi:DNA-binding GntR family transcriptional regulator
MDKPMTRISDTTTQSEQTVQKNRSETAYAVILDMIQQRQLPSGVPLVEQQLATKIQVSRTPLRHAMQRLEAEGLLSKDNNKSFIVRKVELKEYLQSLRVRELLEAEAASMSLGYISLTEIEIARTNLQIVQSQSPYDMISHWRSDDEVHNLFINNCGNDTLINILNSLRTTTKLFEIEKLSERLEPDSQQHELILDALLKQDAKATKRAVATHIKSLFQFAVRTVA